MRNALATNPVTIMVEHIPETPTIMQLQSDSFAQFQLCSTHYKSTSVINPVTLQKIALSQVTTNQHLHGGGERIGTKVNQ